MLYIPKPAALLVLATFYAAATAQVSLELNPETQFVEIVTSTPPTLSVSWDRTVQSYVVTSGIGPTLASGAYGTLHTAIYDAYAAFSAAAKPSAATGLKAPKKFRNRKSREQAMHWAAFFVLRNLFPDRVSDLRAELRAFGVLSVPAPVKDVARKAANAVLRMYAKERATDRVEDKWTLSPRFSELDQWTAERIPIDDPTGPLQSYLTPEWGRRQTFGVENGKAFRPPPPEHFLLKPGTVNFENKTITLTRTGRNVPISKALIGSIINPQFIAQSEEVVEFSRTLDDRGKLVAEFWEDGGGTSFPPGTWMTFAQFVSARDNHNIHKDVRLFFAMGNAVRDAGIASWNAKLFYSYARPVRVIRQLGELGLIGEFDAELGGYAFVAYSMAEQKAVKMLASTWTTYQTPGSHPSPPFPEYTSGHSAFSRSGAEVLKRFTKSDDFGASITIKTGESRFEPGVTPQEDLTLSWPTFSVAAEEAGVSRLYGGIHFRDGNVFGGSIGRGVGRRAFQKASRLWTY